MGKVMKVAIALQKMNVEHGRNRYDSGIFQEVENALNSGSFIDEYCK